MSKNKPREFWITIDDEYQYLDGVRVHTEFMIATESKMSTYKKSYRVIERSAYDALEEKLRVAQETIDLMSNYSSDSRDKRMELARNLALAIEALRMISNDEHYAGNCVNYAEEALTKIQGGGK